MSETSWQERAEKAEAACAAMREALEGALPFLRNHALDCGGINADKGFQAALAALSTNAGRDYIEREKVKPLGEALQRMWDLGEMGYIVADGKPTECGECGSIGKHSDYCFQGVLEESLKLADQLGLTKEAKP